MLAKVALPSEAIRKDARIIPMASGTSMEDGGLWAAREAVRLTFVGSDSKPSVLCMYKSLAKAT
jgi:D-alanine-D-alanine ligase-like ATP-grasp enzyme